MNKLFIVGLIGFSCNAFSNIEVVDESFINDRAFEIHSEQKTPVKKHTVITEQTVLIPKKEKEEMISLKINEIKNNKRKISKELMELKKIKLEHEKKIQQNNKEKRDRALEISSLKSKINERKLHHTNNRINKIVKSLGNNSMRVKYVRPSGKTINLIKYKIKKNDSFYEIMKKTILKKKNRTMKNIKERARVVVSMNTKIKNINHISENDIIYIPIFKEKK